MSSTVDGAVVQGEEDESYGNSASVGNQIKLIRKKKSASANAAPITVLFTSKGNVYINYNMLYIIYKSQEKIMFLNKCNFIFDIRFANSLSRYPLLINSIIAFLNLQMMTKIF